MVNKKRIPAAVRNAVWNTYIGNDVGKILCFVGCGEYITRGNYECGHVLSEKNNGQITITNLRPICSTCNKSMNTIHMYEFMNLYELQTPSCYKQKHIVEKNINKPVNIIPSTKVNTNILNNLNFDLCDDLDYTL